MYMAIRLDTLYPDAKSRTSFQDGLEFQDFVCQQLARQNIILQNTVSKRWQIEVGENLQGFEIKMDSRCTETGRLSIEIAEKSRADMPAYIPSGIYRNDNTWLYIQGNREVLYIFPKAFLVRLFETGKYPVVEMPTIRKFYLPFKDADKYAAKVLRFDEVTA
jgi:hypothetical protein